MILGGREVLQHMNARGWLDYGLQVQAISENKQKPLTPSQLKHFEPVALHMYKFRGDSESRMMVVGLVDHRLRVFPFIIATGVLRTPNYETYAHPSRLTIVGERQDTVTQINRIFNQLEVCVKECYQQLYPNFQRMLVDVPTLGLYFIPDSKHCHYPRFDAQGAHIDPTQGIPQFSDVRAVLNMQTFRVMRYGDNNSVLLYIGINPFLIIQQLQVLSDTNGCLFHSGDDE